MIQMGTAVLCCFVLISLPLTLAGSFDLITDLRKYQHCGNELIGMEVVVAKVTPVLLGCTGTFFVPMTEYCQYRCVCKGIKLINEKSEANLGEIDNLVHSMYNFTKREQFLDGFKSCTINRVYEESNAANECPSMKGTVDCIRVTYDSLCGPQTNGTMTPVSPGPSPEESVPVQVPGAPVSLQAETPMTPASPGPSPEESVPVQVPTNVAPVSLQAETPIDASGDEPAPTPIS